MDIKLLQARHSVRDYDTRPVPDDVAKALQAELTMTNTHEAGLWFQIRLNDSDPFRGFTRSYGFFKNAANYVACVIEPSYPHTVERAGYFAERFVMKAVELGLGTCFVGGTFSAGHVNVPLRAGQKILMLILFGYEAEKPRKLISTLTSMMKRKRRAADSFFNGGATLLAAAEKEFPALAAGLEGVACAPSWRNGQPVSISVREGDGNHFTEPGKNYLCADIADANVEHQHIDLGIAKFNFEAAVTGAGHPGTWEWGPSAPFIPD